MYSRFQKKFFFFLGKEMCEPKHAPTHELAELLINSLDVDDGVDIEQILEDVLNPLANPSKIG